MTNRTKIAVLKAGIVPSNTLPELARWGLKLPEVSIDPDPRNALDDIREAIESKETVELRETDLDALKTYSENRKVGRLYYSMPDASIPGKKRTTFTEVTYAVTSAGLYLIPWMDEDISDLMIDEDTYLKPDGEERVYFTDVSDLFYGEQKAFMICEPLVRKRQ